MDRIPIWTRKKNSLEDVRRFLDYLGNPGRDRPAIRVTGTNGKGFTCILFTSISEEAGYNTSTFILPHLAEVCECFLINGRTMDQEGLEGAFEIILEASRKPADQGPCRPIFFEFLFYMAMVLLRMCDVDVMILETSMDGRLDAANALERPATYVITSISMDHTKYLGDTSAKVAGEKTSIIKTGVPFVFDGGQPEVSTILEGFAFCRGATRYPVGRDDFRVEEIGGKGLPINTRMKDDRYLELGIPLGAFYQTKNAVSAVCTLDALRHPEKRPRARRRIPGHGPCICPDGMEWGISDQHIVKGPKNIFWPGRMGQVKPGIYLDGTHNPGGIEVFIQIAGGIPDRQGKKPWLLFTAVPDKGYERITEQSCREMIWEVMGVVHMNSDRGLAVEASARVFRIYTSRPAYSYRDTKSVIWDVAEKSREKLLLCADSLYPIDEIKAVFEQKT